jgi:hypothetical protein
MISRDTLKELLKEARKGSVKCQQELLDNICQCSFDPLSIMDDTDTQWLTPLAQQGDIKAIRMLYSGATRSMQHWVDEFVDEETGEKILLDRYDPLDGATFTTSTDELYKLIEGIDSFTDEDVSLLNSSILQGNHRVSEHLYDKHRNAGFALTLAENYYYGAEEQGIFIDKEKARYYYDLAGEDMPEMEEDDDLSDICTATFTINGDKQQIGQIAELIKNLTTQFGTPDCESGLYLPIMYLTENLVGSNAYEGLIMACENNDFDGLELKVETYSNVPRALKCALQREFPLLMINYNIG